MRSPILAQGEVLAPNLFLCQLLRLPGVLDQQGLHRDWKP